MKMRIIKSIKGRWNGLKNDFRSHYWEFIRFAQDGKIWENTILFESFGGKNFQGNPHYLFKEAFASDVFSNFRLYIAHQQPDECSRFLTSRRLTDDRVRVILYGSAEYRRVLSHAQYLVNNVSFSINWVKKENQIYLNTWHGTPLKALGRSIKNSPFEFLNAQRNLLLADILLAPNVLTGRVLMEDHMLRGIHPGKLVFGGYPRNTVFFDRGQRDALRERFGLSGKTVIFYMPTWRGTASGVRQIDYVSEMELLAEELGEQYVVYCKLHPTMVQSLGQLRYCREMPEEYEVYEFLNAADILLTDYSSVYFDFAITGRKTILYQFDRDSYFTDRGVYPDALEQTPYPVVRTYEELKREILFGSEPDVEAFRAVFCPMDSPDAAKQLLRQMTEYSSPALPAPVDLYVITFPTSDEALLRWKRQLAGQNYRFVFVPRRSNRRFSNVTCWDQIDYITCRDTSRRTVKEHLFCSKKTVLREKKRLWGDINIGHIYAKAGRLPVCLRERREPWPENLK